MYFVYEVYPDDAKYLVFSSVDRFDFILYKHKLVSMLLVLGWLWRDYV